jgi:hypothetical protein
MNTTWKAVLGVGLIFILGWVTGAVSASLFIRHKAVTMLKDGSPAVATALERRLTRGMALDDSQDKAVYAALLKNLTQRADLQHELQPRVQELNRQTLGEVDAVLKPDQQARFLENYKAFRNRFGNVLNSGPESPPASR